MLFQGSIFPNPPKRNRFFLQINLIWKNINISLEIKIAMLKEMICNSLQSKTRLKIYSCQKERSKSDKKTSKKWLVGFLKNCRWSGKGKWNNWMGGRDDIGLGREGSEVKLIHEMFPNFCSSASLPFYPLSKIQPTPVRVAKCWKLQIFHFYNP